MSKILKTKSKKIKVYSLLGIGFIFMVICIFSLVSDSNISTRNTQTLNKNSQTIEFITSNSKILKEEIESKELSNKQDYLYSLSEWRQKINNQINNLLIKENSIINKLNYENNENKEKDSSGFELNNNSNKDFKNYKTYLLKKQKLVDEIESLLNKFSSKNGINNNDIEGNDSIKEEEEDLDSSDLNSNEKYNKDDEEKISNDSEKSKDNTEENNSNSSSSISINESNSDEEQLVDAKNKKLRAQKKKRRENNEGKAIGEEDDIEEKLISNASDKKNKQREKNNFRIEIKDKENETTLAANTNQINNMDFISNKKNKPQRSTTLRVLLFFLAVLSLGALIIIGYEIRQNYKSTKIMSNTFSECIPEVNQNIEYNLIEDFKKDGDRDDLGIQHL